jgi:16S rRNA (guanine(527)-N(7))-methyltransferase GidB
VEINEFIDNLKLLGIKPSEKQLEQLEKYYELLVFWNEKMNLTGITEKKDVYLKHFYDSLTLAKTIDLNDKSLCDVGSGAGFPGMVLKIIFPKLHVTLIDSLNKRITFLKEVKKELRLEDIDIYHERAEEYALKVRDKFDIVTSRAVAALPVLMEYSVPLAKVNGYFIPMKANLNEELDSSKKAVKTLNIELETKEEFKLPIENSSRTLLKYKKVSKTPSKYPRKYGEIKKRPL